MSAPKRQHLLPKFYLRGFCNHESHKKDTHRQIGDSCWVWVHDREQGVILRRGIKKLSTQTHYYSTETPTGEPDTSPEEVLAGIEGRVAPVIARLRPGIMLSAQERTHLAVFAASMKFRASGYRPFFEAYVERNKSRIMKRAFPGVESLTEGLRNASLPEAEDPELIERTFHDIHTGKRELKLDKNQYIKNLFEHTRKVARKLLEIDWTFAWAPKNYSFATSDDPVLVLGPDLKASDGFFGEYGFASPNTMIVLPLTQEVCFLVGLGGLSIQHIRLRREWARYLNREQTRNYERLLIARDEALVKRLVRDRTLGATR